MNDAMIPIVTGFLGIATLLTIRCPGCDLSLAVWAFQNGSLTTWHERLVELKACPTCGLAVPERE